MHTGTAAANGVLQAIRRNHGLTPGSLLEPVIFRTAAAPSLLPGRLGNTLLNRWRYQADTSASLSAADRSAIYGGFHLYTFEG